MSWRLCCVQCSDDLSPAPNAYPSGNLRGEYESGPSFKFSVVFFSTHTSNSFLPPRSSSSFLQASSSSTLRFYATNRYVVDPITTLRSFQITLHAYEKFGVIFNPPRPSFGECTGLPVRVWRDFTSAIGIRKAGPSLTYISSPVGREKFK
jgi:hypothetical protein